MIDDKILEKINDLRQDNTSGASEFIEKSLEIIKKQLKLISDGNTDITNIIRDLSNMIINSRPSMAPLINTIGYLISDLDVISKKNISSRIKQFYHDKKTREQALESAFRRFMKERNDQVQKILLISYSSTIIKLLTKLQGVNLEIYVLESRPLFEGRRTAELLSKYFKVHVMIDAAMGKFMDEVDLVLIGIDSILKDGSIINKIGTLPLAVVAYNKIINVFAVGDSFKYNLKSHYGLNVIIEQKTAEEVYKEGEANDSITVHNYYFDITPSKYITGIISDLGVLSIADFLKNIEKSLPLNWFQFWREK